MKTLIGLLLLVTAGLGCSGAAQPERTQLGDVAADTQTMKAAKDAAEEVVTASGDCDAVKAAVPEALRQLDEIKDRVRTSAGQAALTSLRKQVTDAAGVCP